MISVDADEFLHHNNLMHALRDAREHGATILEPQGYQMIADAPPSRGGLITDEIRRGAPDGRCTEAVLLQPAGDRRRQLRGRRPLREPDGPRRERAVPGPEAAALPLHRPGAGRGAPRQPRPLAGPLAHAPRTGGTTRKRGSRSRRCSPTWTPGQPRSSDVPELQGRGAGLPGGAAVGGRADAAATSSASGRWWTSCTGGSTPTTPRTSRTCGPWSGRPPTSTAPSRSTSRSGSAAGT